WAPAPLVLACLLGGVLMVIGAAIDDREPRRDSFAVIAVGGGGRGGGGRVVRLDVPPGWRVETDAWKNGHSTVLFTPEGEVAFQPLPARGVYDKAQRRWRPYESMAEFVRENEAQGHEVERRKMEGGGEVGVARKSAPDLWKIGDPRAVLVTYFVEGPGE